MINSTVATFIAAFATFGLPLIASAQGSRPNAYMQRTFRDVDRAARAASPKDSISINAMTEAVLNATWFAGLPPSIHDRLFRSTRDFMTGYGHTVTESLVVKAVDRLAGALGVPGWFITTGEQVRVFRMNLLPLSPTILESPSTPAGQVVTQEMTPAGAAYLGLILFQQKVVNPSYQLDADEWCVQMQAPRSPADAPAEGWHIAEGKWKLSDERLAFLARLQGEITSGSPGVTNAIHDFFQSLGFPEMKEAKRKRVRI
jgi:hypothetical protein